MSANGHPTYELRHLPPIGQRLKDLAETATAQGRKTAFLSALRAVVVKLTTEPSNWGDPVYNLKKPGARNRAVACIMAFSIR